MAPMPPKHLKLESCQPSREIATNFVFILKWLTWRMLHQCAINVCLLAALTQALKALSILVSRLQCRPC